MKLAIQQVTPSEVKELGNLVVLTKFSVTEDQILHRHLNLLKSAPDGPWRRRRKTKCICDVFVVCDPSNPQSGQIEKSAIKRKTGDTVVLRNFKKFDVKTGRSLNGEKYIWPVEDDRVQAAWESQRKFQFLHQGIRRDLPDLPTAVVREYADLLDPRWRSDLFCKEWDGFWGHNFDQVVGSPSKREAATIVACCEAAERSILNHLPEDINELGALAAMIEGDVRR
jgi:hypothetical protein